MRISLPKFLGGIAAFALALTITANPLTLLAQSESTQGQDAIVVPGAEVAPGVTPSTSTNSPDALFDIQFNHNITALSGRTGCAGVVYVNNEFWVSKWASDTLLRFSNTGTFLNTFFIPGVTGIRSLTYDGTNVYAATNTSTIYRINPATATTVAPNINVNAGVGNVRHMSFDPTLDNNNGGFWVGNFGTDIFGISLTGNILTTIPAATHGMTGMYGSAYDPFTAGGPYLWVFCQSAPNNSQLYRLQLPSGTATVVTHDVMSDVGPGLSLTSGLAGGLFITDQVVPSQRTIVGVIQGTPNNGLFGYSLEDFNLPDYDARLTSMRPVEGYTQIPTSQLFAESFEAQYQNFGANALDTLYVDFVVRNGGNTVFTDTRFVTNVASGASGSILSTGYTPANGVGSYDVWAIARTPLTQVDSVSSNDSVMFNFQVTDSTYARDDNQPDGGAGYSVGAGSDYCYVSTNYTLFNPATVTAVWIKVASAVDGDSTRAMVFNTISGTFPDLMLAHGQDVILNSATTEYLLNIPGGLSLQPGTYSFGCYQAIGKTIKLAQSPNIWTADVNYFFVPGNTWTSSGVQTARFIRPVFGTPVGVGVNASANDFVQLFPNPSEGEFALSFNADVTETAQVSVMDAVGKEVYRQEVQPNGQFIGVDLGAHPAGVYFVRVESGSKVTTKRLLITK